MSTSLSRRVGSTPFWLALGALAGVLIYAAVGARTAGAEPAQTVETVFLSVTGEGPTAKAWFEGAQPSGIAIQRALQAFNEKGFRAILVTEPHPSKAGEFAWSILMEKRR